MKAKTVIILVICGALLLTVAAFGIFFARGGEVLYWYSYTWTTGAYHALISIEREDVAKEIAALDFTFDLTPKMKVHFKGTNYRVYPLTETGGPTGVVIGERYLLSTETQFDGKVQYSIPWQEAYIEVNEDEFLERLNQEIKQRISPDSEFQIKDFFHYGDLWGKERYKLKKLPKKQ